MTLKKTFLTLILVIISASCFAQLQQGAIHYTMKIFNGLEDESTNTFTTDAPEVSIITTFTPKYLRMELSDRGEEGDILINDKETQEILILSNKGTKQNAYLTTVDEFDTFLKEANTGMTEDQGSHEERIILGYKCTKTSFTSRSGEPTVYWHTNEIITGLPLAGVPMSIPGTCLHYEMNIMEGFRIVYTAVKVSKEIPEAKLFDMEIPEGYELKPIEELLSNLDTDNEDVEMTPAEVEELEIAIRELEETLNGIEEVIDEEDLPIESDNPEPITPEEYEGPEPVQEVVNFPPDVEAEFHSGEEAMHLFIEENIGKPKCLNLKHPVSVEFDIEKDGKVSNVVLNGDLSDKCKIEILDVFESMPRWVPGESRGRKTVNHVVVVVPNPEQ